MPTDLYPIHLGANVVGIVDHPVTEPQKPLLDNLQVLYVIGHLSAPQFTLLVQSPHASGSRPVRTHGTG